MSPPLVGPGIGPLEKKPAVKPGEKKPDAKTPDKKGTPLPVPQTPSKPVVHKTPMVEDYLKKGQLAEGEAALIARLKESPRDEEARASLGAVQFLRAVERLSQALYRYGYRNRAAGVKELDLPLLRLPVPRNLKPQPLSYLQAREILKEFVSDLEKAEATLATSATGRSSCRSTSG